MIWRLTYCNKDGVEARLDIIRGASTPVEVIEGTGTPFILNYKLDKSDKSGFFMTSSADISIFETASFNIDNLKTSSETEIKVEHYINNVLDWSGFVIPDFFSKAIGTPATVEMVASDRLGTLKGVTPEDLSQYESMRDLAVKCLAKTGLSLPLYTMADFGNNGTTNAFFKALGLSGRLSDTKGRNISCYDILKSILVASNSKLVQQGGAWHIVNKWQHEQGAGNLFSTLTASTAYSEQTVNFSDVHVGARRTIIPVGATTGVFQEFGGGRSYPENYNFSDGTTGWTANGGFIPLIKTTPITSYLIRTNDAQFNSTISVNPYLFNSNTFSTDKYLQTKSIIPYDTGKIEVSIEINATGPMMGREELASEIRVSIGIEISTGLYRWLNDSGAFISDTATVLNGKFPTRSPGFDNYRASTGTFGFKGTYDNPMGKNLVIRIYGSYEGASKREIGYNFVSATFKQSLEEPKGTIYKRTQGVGFTKGHDLDTTIFGDYLTIGLDGAFYQSRVDDTSYLYSTAGTLTEPLWTAHGDTEQLPLLRHVTRQKSRMFSLAHNMISARIDVSTFKPLSIFVDCNSVNPRHVVVSATYDFLRSEVEVELEQIAYATLDVREFIYSYFGDGESGISSVGGISGGGTGTGGGGSGGGMTADQVAILSEVQELAHDHGNKEVLDQVTQDVVDNALREMIISTDTETELTDENYLSSLRVLKEILDNNEYLRTQFLSKVNPDTAQEIIKFVKGIEIGTFTAGALGSGAAIKMVNGTSYAEVDHLTVRQKATFRELIIEALKHIGGQLVLSPARMKCNKVVDGGTYYKCYFDTGDGEVSNEFVTGDQARCQVFTGSGTKFYWRLVTSVGEDWINLSKTDAVVGSDAPASGDDISQLGNRTDITRQSAIILSTVEADAPSWKQYSGINSFDLASKETTVFTRLGNRIQGKTVFTSGGTNLEDVLDGVSSDIQDTQAAANAAALKAQQAIDDAEANVGLINTEVGKLQAQLDGEVSNWFYPYSPTLANYPASDWTTNEIKDRHVGDTFTNTAQAPATDAGKSWRFVKNRTVYSWTQIADSDAVKALLEASKAQATADGKSTTHLFQPTKYKLGDMWVLNADQTVNGTLYKQGDLLTATQDSATYNQAHWVKRVRYTDDTKANQVASSLTNFTDTVFPQEKNQLQSQIDGKIESHFTATDPATAWTTADLKTKHTGDMWFNSTTKKLNRYSGSGWVLIEDQKAIDAFNTASTAKDTADGKRRVFTSTPTVPYDVGDLWAQGTSGDLMRCTTPKTSAQSYSASDWEKASKYTDDTAVNELEIGGRNLVLNSNFLSGLGNTFYNSGGTRELIDGVAKFTIQGYTGTSMVRFYELTVSNIPSGIYTFSIRARAEERTGVFSNWKGANIISSKHIAISDEFALYTVKFEKTTNEDSDLIIRIYQNRTSQTSTEPAGVIWVDWYALVRGDKPMIDWSPAPEDVQAEIDTAKQEALNAAGNAQSSANSANAAVGSLNTYVDGAFKDGVISEAEAKAIEKYKNTINEAMAKAEASFAKVFANTYLEGTAKTALLNAKINLWGQRDTLLSAINTAISGGTTTPAQKTAVDNAFNSFNNLMTAFQNALEEANKAIQAKLDALSTEKVNNIQIGGRNLFSVNDFVADNKARGYGTIEVINYNGNIAYRSSSIVNNHDIPHYLQGKFEANTQYYLQFKINWESYTNSGAQYAIMVVYTDGTTSNLAATTSQTYRAVLTAANKTIDYITTTRQYDGTVVIYNIQLEKGNKPSDWRPALEDTERELLEAQGYMKARYIRDYINGSSANNTNHWNELKVFNKAGVNIAIGKIPTSNGVLVNPANLTDNILNNFTHITPTPTTPTSQYIQIDLGQVHYDIDYIHVWHYYLDGRTYNGTKTQISEDGITWKTIFDSAVSGTYVETEGGKVHTQRYASVMDRIAETEAKTRFQTLIDGGLIYTALMKLFDTISGDETAFISGKQGAGKNLPAFGAGGSYQDALAGTAKAIIRHDGSSKFTDTEITGTVNATSGSIGGLNIYDNAIASYPDLGVLVPPGEHIHISKTGVSIDRNVGLSQNQVITSVRITDDGIRVSKSDSDGYKSMEVRIDGIYRNGVKIL